MDELDPDWRRLLSPKLRWVNASRRKFRQLACGLRRRKECYRFRGPCDPSLLLYLPVFSQRSLGSETQPIEWNGATAAFRFATSSRCLRGSNERYNRL